MVYGWTMLPMGVVALFLMEDLPHIDFRSGSLEERLANAAFDSLTKERYDAALAVMAADARRRLFDGQVLSDTDNRLLASVPLEGEMAIARAKAPGNESQAREALRRIDGEDTLVDIALHAKNPSIRGDAAKRISGLPESRLAALVHETGDSNVATIFLSKMSDDDLLRGIVEDTSVPQNIRTAAFGKIARAATLADFAKSPDG